jgi:copper chaperone CopZ
MKNIFKTILITLVFITGTAFTPEKSIKTSINVSGNCGQCKTRIETALDVKGVRFAEFNLEKKQLDVIYNPKKISIEAIHTLIQNAGHDTEKGKATDTAYNQLPGCCRYRDGACHEH